MGDHKAPQESANDASLMDSLAVFVGTGAADHNSKHSNSSTGGGGPETMMHLPNNQAQQDMMLANQQQVMTQPQQQQQQQPRGPSSASSSSPGILSYTGTIKTALGPSQAPSSSLLDMTRRRSSLNPTGDDGCSAGSSSISISMSLGTQAQAQASHGVDASFSAGANNIGMNAGAAGANGAAVSVVMQQQANINHGNGTTMMAGPPAPSSLPMMPSNCQNAMLGNTNDAMINGDNAMAGGLNLGRLTPPTHPSAHANGGQDNSFLSHNSSCAQQNTFQQQQQQQQQLQQQHQQSNFSIGPSTLMGESLTTPSPFDMGSIPSMPQSVLRSQSVGSVQSTISFASTGSASMTSDLGNNNRATGRMAGGGGFLGPAPSRALGPGGLGIKRAKRSRARSDGSNSISIDASDGMAAKSNIQALVRLHASIGGKQPNAEGMCPIHIACRDYPTNARLIGTMLCTSPGVGRLVVGRGSSIGAQVTGRRPSLSSTNSGESSRSNTIVMEGSYPIHIALAYSANVDVVKLLVRQNPELLIKGDGTNRVPLSIAFSHGASLDVLDLLLGMNPNAAAIPDLRNNFPLHLACARRMGGGGGQINLPLLKRLVEAFPAAVHKCNFNGKTPLELAQDGGVTDDDAISYLHEMAYMERDDDVIEAPDA